MVESNQIVNHNTFDENTGSDMTTMATQVKPTTGGGLSSSTETSVPKSIAKLAKKKTPNVEEALAVIEYCDARIKEAAVSVRYGNSGLETELKQAGLNRLFAAAMTGLLATFTGVMTFSFSGDPNLSGAAVVMGGLMAPSAIVPMILGAALPSKDSPIYTVIAPFKSKKLRAKWKIENSLSAMKYEEFKKVETEMLEMACPSQKILNESLESQGRQILYSSEYAAHGFVVCEKQELKELDKWEQVDMLIPTEMKSAKQLTAKKSKKEVVS